MNPLLRPLAFAAFALTVAGCGGSAAAGISSASTPPPAFIAAAAQDLVLGPQDVGAGWTQVPDETKTVSLEDSMKDDPPALRKVESGSYRSGYQTLYVDRKADGILLGTFTYDSSSVAQQVADGWSLQASKQMKHPSLLPAPADAPGDHFSAWQGQIPQKGHMIPGYMVMWSHANAVGAVFLFGVDAKASAAFKLATDADKRFTNPA